MGAIVVAIAGIIISVVMSFIMYAIGKRDGKKEKHDDRMRQRIDRMADLCAEWERTAYDNGIHALTRLGLEELEEDSTIRMALKRIEIATGRKPLGKWTDQLAGVDLFAFFKHIREDGIDVNRTDIEPLIERIKRSNS